MQNSQKMTSQEQLRENNPQFGGIIPTKKLNLWINAADAFQKVFDSLKLQRANLLRKIVKLLSIYTRSCMIVLKKVFFIWINTTLQEQLFRIKRANIDSKV